MADEPATPVAPVAGRIPVLAPDPATGRMRFATVDVADADAVKKAGGKVLSRAEVKERELQEAYDKKSTLEKAAGYATPALPAPIQMALRGAGVAPMTPELEAYRAGASQAFSGGLEAVGTKEAIDFVAGKQAAHAFGQTQADLKEAHAGMYSAGEVAGFIGGAVAGGPKGGLGNAGKAIPGVGISALGGLAEQGAAKVLAPMAARGAIGRAIATGGELAARGAVEGSLYGAANQVSEDMLGDRELAADKVFSAMGTGGLYGALGGAALGAGGSLLASGAKGAVSAARSGIGRVLAKGEGVAAEAAAGIEGAATKAEAGAASTASRLADEAVTDATASGKGIAEATGTKVEQEAGAAQSWIDKVASKDAQKGMAYEQAWKAAGAGQGLQSTSFAKSAERYLPNGTKDVGEAMLRHGIINTEDGLINAMRAGTPEAMVPKFESAKAIVGSRIGDITAASPARVSGVEIGEAVNRVAQEYEQSAATRPIGKTLRAYAENLRDSLGITELDSHVAVQDLLRERKALDKMVFENAALDPSLAIQVKRQLRGELEGLVIKGMDDASGQVPGALKAEYKALKHDYTALSIGLDAAEDSAARMHKAATFGLTDTLRGGGSVIKTVGSKVVRERGNAAAAVLLSRMADMGTLTKAIRAVDEQVGRASAGVLALPKKGPLPGATPVGSVHARADDAMRRVSELQANPEQLAERAAAAAEPYQTTAPNLASALSQRMTSAAAFMMSKLPTGPDPDPFDPHPRPKLTDAQAAEFAAYDHYAQKPSRFFEEAAHGKMTFEGVEVARALMPSAFAEMQQRTVEGLADLMAKGTPPPYVARQRIGIMLGIPAVPEQRPDHMGFLQANVIGSEKAEKAPQGAQSHPKRPMPTKAQSSTLDRLEGK